MSISAVTSTSSTPLNASDFNQRKTNLDALESALNSGDLSAAQSAFNTIQQDMQNMPQLSAATQSTGIAQARSDFQKIGDALKSGDTEAAKQAFATWQQDMQKMRTHHHHGGHRPNQTAQPAPVAGSTDTSSSPGTFSVKA